jgi:hypothetical protein
MNKTRAAETKWELDVLLEAHDRLISRVEEKGETVTEAAEAVGDEVGGPAFVRALIAFTINREDTMTNRTIQVGDVINIPVWNVTGTVSSIWDKSADAFSTDTSTTLLMVVGRKEHRFRVEPGEFTFVSVPDGE